MRPVASLVILVFLPSLTLAGSSILETLRGQAQSNLSKAGSDGYLAQYLLKALRDDVSYLRNTQVTFDSDIEKQYREILESYHEELRMLPMGSLKKYHLDLLSEICDDIRTKVEFAKHGANTREIQAHKGRIYALAFSGRSDGVLTSGGEDNMIYSWDLRSGRQVGKAIVNDRLPVAIEVDAKRGRTIVASIDGKVKSFGGSDKASSWQLDTGFPKMPLALSSMGHVGLGNTKGNIEIWNVADKKMVGAFEGHYDRASSVAFSPSGGVVCAVTPGKGLSIWYLDEKKRATLPTSKETDFAVVSIASKEDKLISVSHGGDIAVWDLQKLSRTGYARLGPYDVSAVAISPNGQTFATVGGSGERFGHLELWDQKDLKKPITYLRFNSSVCEVRFTPEGDKLVTAHQDGTIRVWSWTAEQVKNPFKLIDITVRTMKDGADANGYTIWFVPRAHQANKDRHRPFSMLSSPSVHPLAAGNYLMWASKDEYVSARIPVVVSTSSPSTVQFSVR